MSKPGSMTSSKLGSKISASAFYAPKTFKGAVFKTSGVNKDKFKPLVRAKAQNEEMPRSNGRIFVEDGQIYQT